MRDIMIREILVVVGYMSQYRIDATVRRATSEGYDVTLVGDANGTNDSTLSAESIVANTNTTLNGFETAEGRGTVLSSRNLVL
jgi:nicotinamidase-related amidase